MVNSAQNKNKKTPQNHWHCVVSDTCISALGENKKKTYVTNTIVNVEGQFDYMVPSILIVWMEFYAISAIYKLHMSTIPIFVHL